MNEITNIFIENPIAQTIGIIAFIIGLIGYISTKDVIIKTLGGVSLIIWVLHYIALGLYSGAMVSSISSIRNIYSIKKPKNLLIVSIFTIIYLIGFYLTYKSLFSIFNLLSAITYLYALFFLKGVNMRYLMILGNIFNLIYAVYGNSIGLAIASTIYTIGTSLSIAKIKYPNGFVYNFFEGIYFKNLYIFITNKLKSIKFNFSIINNLKLITIKIEKKDSFKKFKVNKKRKYIKFYSL